MHNDYLIETDGPGGFQVRITGSAGKSPPDRDFDFFRSGGDVAEKD
jgi:hypothetical protein